METFGKIITESPVRQNALQQHSLSPRNVVKQLVHEHEKMNVRPDSRRVVELDSPPLPVACPNEHAPADLLHPRVWLDPTQEGMAICPYCGTIYRFRPDKVVGNAA